ncbi:hypothetical protein NDA07_21685 [Microcoleus vaginatus DQ-U2]|uniref:hypothetical protein n=1 Tax=Microcoleus vaginatus TaxID=119532 RepID=UPI0016855B27|nr:hypothetical protein [Microcoleus sp. FACHB-DQ6]
MCGSKKPLELIRVTANRRLHPDLVKTVFFRIARKQEWDDTESGDRNYELLLKKTVQ